MKIKSGARKRRAIRPKEKKPIVGYDSNWEYVLHTSILTDWKHHKEKPVDYIVEHKYHPDFVRIINGKKILLESKGRFWDYGEYNKYIWIKKVLPENVELVFLFAEPNAPMPQAKRRKDGTKRSHGEWAWSKGFKWYSEESIPDSWINVKAKLNKEQE
tara:strand:- start:2658 stop:3131 length:474 start_codon:yes stop_codon:yes gene_type:complete